MTLRRALTPEFFENGLAARLLVAMPPRRPKRWSEATVDESMEHKLACPFEWLWLLEPDTDPGSGDLRPKLIPLESDGRKAWIDFYNEHAVQQAELSGDLAAAWSKLEGYCARFALLIHCVRQANGEVHIDAGIEARTIEAAITLTRWFG
jgi:uncharacterized protein DUF3987